MNGNVPLQDVFKTKAQMLIDSLLSKNDEEGSMEIFHFDCHSSLLLSGIVPWLVELISKRAKKVKIVWEISELDHVDPNTATRVPILTISDRKFTEEDICDFHLKKIIARFLLFLIYFYFTMNNLSTSGLALPWKLHLRIVFQSTSSPAQIVTFSSNCN